MSQVDNSITDKKVRQIVNPSLALLGFRLAAQEAMAKFNMVDGILDVFTDETGIDTGDSLNELYDATNDLYSNAGGVDLIPDMTALDAPSGLVSASTVFATYYAWQAFDKVNSGEDGWLASATSGWLQYQFATAQIIKMYSLLSRNTGNPCPPKSWTLKASNTGDFTGEEVTLDTQTDITDWATSANTKKTFNFTNTTAYLYYRIIITESNDALYVGFGEVQMMTDNNLTLISNAVTADSTPNTAFAVVQMEEIDTVDLAADLLFYVSRDGGSNWVSKVMTAETFYDATTYLLIADFDLSSIATGTSVIWKIVTANNVQMKIKGVALLWQ